MINDEERGWKQKTLFLLHIYSLFIHEDTTHTHTHTWSTSRWLIVFSYVCGAVLNYCGRNHMVWHDWFNKCMYVSVGLLYYDIQQKPLI